MHGRQVKLFLVDGTAGGLITAEIGNWTGHILRGKREKLGEIRRREEAQRTGVYILLGEDPSMPAGQLAYIGQSDNVATRLANHDAKKDWWNEVLIITSKDLNLTSAHVRFIESRLIAIAKSIARTPLENGNTPTGGAELPEGDRSDMEYFIEQVRVLLPVLGVNLLRGQARPVKADFDERAHSAISEPVVPQALGPERSPVFRLSLPKRNVDARAQMIDGEFTMLEGSAVAEAMAPLTASAANATRRQHLQRAEVRQELFDDGSIKPDETGIARLTRDVVFRSASAAAAVAVGRASANGRIEWCTEDGQTYASWEDAGAQH
ncbi:GIY-YIG nuclease family protein [Helcobacillus massiliensis]|uniref:GIY-YIG nuclease family protein n=1 Tax=Helcobacillus massiliensis TaxID=521392 RepID=UPI0039EF0329